MSRSRCLCFLWAIPRVLALSKGYSLGLGVDLGTSGVRACVVSLTPGQPARVVGEAKTGWSDEDGRLPEIWLSALKETLAKCERASEAQRICVSGTSASVLTLEAGRVSRGPMMYGDAVDGAAGDKAMNTISLYSPKGHVTRSRTSALAKVLAWQFEQPLRPSELVVHQADYVAAKLAGDSVFRSDWHNALKLGYDVGDLRWPEWLVKGALGTAPASTVSSLQVSPPGSAVATVSAEAAKHWDLCAGAQVVGGTTDSIAAYLGCSATNDGQLSLKPGTAVTSLGSTTAIKLVSTVRVDDPDRGVYSHRLKNAWLVGGASNAGTAILRAFNYSNAELATLSKDLHVDDKPYNRGGIYPLVRRGERFPFNDPEKAPVLPDNDADRLLLLEALLIGIADVEREGYEVLRDLGATPLTRVKTAGGGAKNTKWRMIRQRMLGVPVEEAFNTDAAYGAALLGLSEQT